MPVRVIKCEDLFYNIREYLVKTGVKVYHQREKYLSLP